MARRQRREEKGESEKPSKKGGKLISPESDIIQKAPGDYKSRYDGLLSPEDDIVEEFKPNYDSRYN